MSAERVRESVDAGRCIAVRSANDAVWTQLADSVFAITEEQPPTVATLGPVEAERLLSRAVASGILKASIAMIGLGILLGLLWQVLR